MISTVSAALGPIEFQGITWQNFSHNNVVVYAVNGIERIVFKGYTRPGYNDFLFYEGKGVEKSQIKFTLDQSGLKYHSMDGGGFLFNTTIQDENINGFMCLFGQNTLDIYRVNMPVEEFYNTKNNIDDMGELQTSISVPPREKITKVIIDIQGSTISVIENDIMILDQYNTYEKPGSGFGPVACFRPHGCDSKSSFSFSDIVASMVLISSDYYRVGDNTTPQAKITLMAQDLQLILKVNEQVIFNQKVTANGEYDFPLDFNKYSHSVKIEAQLKNDAGELLGQTQLTFDKRNVLNEIYAALSSASLRPKFVILDDEGRYFEDNTANRALVEKIRMLDNTGFYTVSNQLDSIFEPLMETEWKN